MAVNDEHGNGEPTNGQPAHEGQDHGDQDHEEREQPAPPPATPPAGDGDRLDRLEGIVTGLVDIVAGLTPKDEQPTKLPWTHRLGRNDR